MPNPVLDKEQLAKAGDLLTYIREELRKLSGGDPQLLFAYRRKVAKMLVYDERSGPNERRKLNVLKRAEQGELCAECREALPVSYTVLDKVSAIDGYTPANTRLTAKRATGPSSVHAAIGDYGSNL
jgi:hypothetical protein